MTDETKLTQMLLTTMVTNENMKWSFLSSRGAGPQETQICQESMDTLTWFLLIWAVILFGVYQQRRRRSHTPTKRVTFTFVDHHLDDYHEAQSISDDDESHEEPATPPPSPIQPSRRAVTGTPLDLSGLMHEYDDDDDYDDVHGDSPSKRHSLRLALKKHRGLGLAWDHASGERYSLRVASHHHNM